MTDIAIRVENLGKRYRIGALQSRHDTLRDAIAARFQRSNVSTFQRSNDDFIWSLRNVSFEVKRGEVVGIIGRNGAGKSTLLKILSRITEPSEGQADLHGHVASLLEVGTGFHGELSGRENIYLSGAIQGMHKAEIDRKFDEIVAFAEVEKFIDTPVKHYSSGMYVRLAFAVAAHLEPEILLVDEVLAVGDAAFQKKCLGKMGDVAREGRTVVFVSHNMSTIQRLCTTGYLFEDGRVAKAGQIDQVIDAYLSNFGKSSRLVSLRERKDRQGSGKVKIVGFHSEDIQGIAQSVLKAGEDYRFVIEYEKNKPDGEFGNVVGSIAITDNKDEMIMLVRSSFTNQNFNIVGKSGYVECVVRDFNLANGSYNTILFLSHGEGEILDLIEHAAELWVEGGDYFGTGSVGLPSLSKVLTRADWKVTART